MDDHHLGYITKIENIITGTSNWDVTKDVQSYFIQNMVYKPLYCYRPRKHGTIMKNAKSLPNVNKCSVGYSQLAL